jgi:uncharacterized protein
MGTHRILLLPGWQNSGPGHWQTLWETQHGHQRVLQHDWHWPLRGDWMAQLESVLQADARPAVLVAHSLGCHLVAAWAAHTARPGQVAGALLVAPPDIEREDMPPQLASWRRATRQRLPFAATAVLSADDPFASLERGRGLALAWGARVVEAGARGHLNADSGLGAWPEGQTLLRDLLAAGPAGAAAGGESEAGGGAAEDARQDRQSRHG